jgi:hypothetical protein
VALVVVVLAASLLAALEISAAVYGYVRGGMSEAGANAEVVFYEIGFVLLIPIAIGVEVVRWYARRSRRTPATGS